MSRIFMGNISTDGERLVNKCIDKYIPDAVIEPLKAAGIRGKIKNHAKRSDVILVILDSNLYDICEGVAGDVLALPKVHKYVDDIQLRAFLERNFGVLGDNSKVEVPVEELSTQEVVVDDDLDNLIVSDEEDTSNDNDKDDIIQKLNDELLIRDTMIRNLEAQLEEKTSNDDVSHFISRIKSLEFDLKKSKEELDDVRQSSYTDLGKIAKAEQVISSVEKLKEDLKAEKDKYLILEGTNNTLQTQLDDSNKKVKELLESLKGYDKVQADYSDLQENFNKQRETLDLKLKDLENALRNNANLEAKIVDLSSQVTEVSVLKDEIELLTQTNKELTDNNSSLSNNLVDLQNLQVDYNALLDTKEQLSQRLEQKSSDILALTTNKETLEKELEDKNVIITELQSKLVNLNDIESKISDKDIEIDNLKSEIKSISHESSSFKLENTSLKDKLETLEKEKMDITSDYQKVLNEFNSLQSKVKSMDSISKDNETLKGEIATYKQEVAKLQSNITLLKSKTDNLDEVTSLRDQLSECKDKLKQAEDNSSAQSDVLSQEVKKLRERCAKLEIDLVSKDNQLKSTENNIFSKMKSNALPKTVFNLTLDVPSNLSNMYVVASGSSESNLVTYQTLRRTCANANGGSILILDLVTDSYIDREFGVDSNIVSPIEFLQGSKSINDFACKTKVGNTFISSTAFSYLNSLYLLNVNWNVVLSSLVGVFDNVIINVGCLNEVVSKVLFNAFSSVMKSHIVIKASPINLRTALLTLTGIPLAKSSKISCVNFENSSKGMYQRLAQKFDTQILKDSDVLKLWEV